MAKFKPQSEVVKYFSYRLAIIQLQPGETNDQAWRRHLVRMPGDVNATIRIFNS